MNTGAVAGMSGKDLNVEPAWMQGITGKGVVVAVFDDGIRESLKCSYMHKNSLSDFSPTGLEWTHPDIRPNYVRFTH